MQKIFTILLCVVLSHISSYGMSNTPYRIDSKNPNKVFYRNFIYDIADMISQGQVHIVGTMLQNGANSNAEVSCRHHKGNLLSLAIYHNNIDMIKMLICFRAIPPQDDLKSFYALVESKGSTIEDIIKTTFLKDFPKPIKYHVTTEVSPKEQTDDNQENLSSSKPTAMNHDIVQKSPTMLQSPTPHVQSTRSPVIQAALDNDCNALYRLLSFNPKNVNASDRYHSLLEIAIINKNLRMVEILLEFNVNIPTSVLFPKFLHEKGTPEIRDLILQHYTIPANEFYNVVHTPFHISHAVIKGYLETVSDLLKNGANPNAQADNGDNLLFLAVKAKNKPMATLLMQYEDARVGFNNIDWVQKNASQEMLDIIYPPTAPIDDQPLPLVEESATDSVNLKATDSSKNKIVSWLSDNKKTSILTVGLSLAALWAFGKYTAKQKQNTDNAKK